MGQSVNGQVDQSFYRNEHTGSMHGYSEIRSRSNVWKKPTHTEGHVYDYAHFQILGLFVLRVCIYNDLVPKGAHENRTKGVENKVDDTLKLVVFLECAQC